MSTSTEDINYEEENQRLKEEIELLKNPPKRPPGNPNLYKGMPSFNPKGRKRGSVNKYTALSRKIMTDKGPEIVNKVIELAMAGDKTCLKMCMDRVLPAAKMIDINASDKQEKGNVIINVGGIQEKVVEVIEEEGPDAIDYEDGVIINPIREDKKIIDIDNHKPTVDDIINGPKVGDPRDSE